MKKLFFCCLGLLLCTHFLFAQKLHPARAAAQRALDEKLRSYNLDNIYAWMEAHPGMPLPEQLLIPNQINGHDRDADGVVSANAEAESEVHAAINPVDSNNIIVSAILQDAGNLFQPLNTPVYYTKDFGQTWATSFVQFNPIPGGIVAGGGDPIVAFDKSGKAFISWLVLTISLGANPPVKLTLYASTSSNGGQTWSSPVKIDEGALSLDVVLGGAGSGTLVDKQWMATDQSNSVNEGSLYVSYTKIEIIDSVTANNNIYLKKKPKNSNAFNANAIKVNTNNYDIVQFSSIAVDKEGTIHITFFAGSSTFDMGVYYTQSTDGGQTFTEEKKISPAYFPGYLNVGGNPDTIAGVLGDRLYPCPHIAVGNEAGELYATWTANGKISQLTEGFDIWFSRSSNNGLTWSAPYTINPGTNEAAEQFYSSIAVNSAGTICVSYYDRTEDPTGTSTNYVVAFSTDGGASFKPSVAASAMPSDFSAIGSLNAGFGIGEYTQVVCTPHTAVPIWADGRTNDGNIEIYAAFIPINGQLSGVHNWGALNANIQLIAAGVQKEQIDLIVEVPEQVSLKVQVLAVDGRLIAQQNATNAASGSHRFTFPVTPGIYFCHVATAAGAKVKKVVVE